MTHSCAQVIGTDDMDRSGAPDPDVFPCNCSSASKHSQSCIPTNTSSNISSSNDVEGCTYSAVQPSRLQLSAPCMMATLRVFVVARSSAPLPAAASAPLPAASSAPLSAAAAVSSVDDTFASAALRPEADSRKVLQGVCDGLMQQLQPLTALLVEVIPLLVPIQVLEYSSFLRQASSFPFYFELFSVLSSCVVADCVAVRCRCVSRADGCCVCGRWTGRCGSYTVECECVAGGGGGIDKDNYDNDDDVSNLIAKTKKHANITLSLPPNRPADQRQRHEVDKVMCHYRYLCPLHAVLHRNKHHTEIQLMGSFMMCVALLDVTPSSPGAALELLHTFKSSQNGTWTHTPSGTPPRLTFVLYILIFLCFQNLRCSEQPTSRSGLVFVLLSISACVRRRRRCSSSRAPSSPATRFGSSFKLLQRRVFEQILTSLRQYSFIFQILPSSVALVFSDSSASDDDSDAFASEVSAAVSAASAASARLDPAAANHHVCLTALHHVLSGHSVGKRCAAMTRLPCFIAKFSPTTQDRNDYTRHVVAAAAVAALSLSFAPTCPLTAHPLSAANQIISSATSRVGISLVCIDSPYLLCIISPPPSASHHVFFTQDLTLPSSNYYLN